GLAGDVRLVEQQDGTAPEAPALVGLDELVLEGAVRDESDLAVDQLKQEAVRAPACPRRLALDDDVAHPVATHAGAATGVVLLSEGDERVVAGDAEDGRAARLLDALPAAVGGEQARPAFGVAGVHAVRVEGVQLLDLDVVARVHRVVSV